MSCDDPLDDAVKIGRDVTKRMSRRGAQTVARLHILYILVLAAARLQKHARPITPLVSHVSQRFYEEVTSKTTRIILPILYGDETFVHSSYLGYTATRSYE